MKQHSPNPSTHMRNASVARYAMAALVTSAAIGLGACSAATDGAASTETAASTVADDSPTTEIAATETAATSTATSPDVSNDAATEADDAPSAPAPPGSPPETTANSTATSSNAPPSAPPGDTTLADPPAAPSGRNGPGGGSGRGGPGGGFAVTSATTVADLNSMLNEAVGDGGLGLHRGHQPITDTLNSVLGISHEELHVRMEQQGQNLAAVATDIGVDPQTLIDALVAAWSPAIDNVEAAGTITADQADHYRQALAEAFTFRVNWNGSDAAPTFNIA